MVALPEESFGGLVERVYIALGVEEVLAEVSTRNPNDSAAPLGWLPLIALYGGVATYLAGRATIRRRATGSTSTVQLIAAGVPLPMLPAARSVPALAALGLITAGLVGLALYESNRTNEQGYG